jgi:gamma-D-glutamyl-L-lysine dipeptidyl-peptidase
MIRRRPPAFAIVRLASLDVRRRPDHAAEMGSQLLMGEVVRLLGHGPGARWYRVENLSDGYRGWVRTWGLSIVPTAGIADWRRRAKGRPARAWLEVRETPGGGALVSPLFWGGRVIPGPLRGRFRRVELPDGTQGWVESRGLDVGRRAAPPLALRVADFMGVPYLWGGRTPAGMDCSGLVQMLLAEQGVWLPRDAADQERSSRRLGPGERPRIGDLAFFGPRPGPAGHVGVVIGGGRYAHARGQVRVNHLDPGNALYDNELARQFRGIRRPKRRRPGGI